MSGKRKTLWDYRRNFLMLAPFFILFSIFYLAPLVYGLYVSFFKWDGVHAPVFNSINNYQAVITSRYFVKAFTNLAKYVIITMFFGITIAFGLALLVSRFKGLASNIFRSAYFLPTVIPLFLTATIWRWILTPDYGILNRILAPLIMLMNQLLAPLGVAPMNPTISWLTDPKFMIAATVIVDVWRSTGFNMIILLAGLKGIDEVYYDAAKVDGANTWQQVLYITIPQLEPVLFLVIVNGFISALQVFDVPWLISNSEYRSYGGPLQGMMFPVMDIMGRTFGSLKFGEASAYAWLLLIVVMIITMIQFIWRRRYRDW